jgi:mono/diheme cytochrome c family protein
VRITIRAWMLGVLLALAVVPCAAQEPSASPAELPPPAARTIDFARDVQPLLLQRCARCHARGRDRGGFSFETRDLLVKGGDGGPAIVPGDSANSLLIWLVAGLDPDMVMPQKGSRLTSDQVGILRAWIDQGAAWDPAVSFAKAPPRHLRPRRPRLPPLAAAPARPAVKGRADRGASDHPIDRLLQPYLTAHDDPGAPLADDRQFARRVFLDAVGVLPSPAELRTFLADSRPGKRALLVARLLGDDRRYAEHWLTFWNDLLRNDYRGTGYIDGGRKQISAWLYAALANNLPYDRFVSALVNPAPATEGFTKGIVWRGVVNASQTPEMQAAQNISQVFMGVNLKCASCHDSFINDWQLSDAYGLAGVYAEGALEMVECDRPTGKTARVKFLYPELGTIDADAPRPRRVEQLASLLTSRENGRLSRTIVNRLWARLMGRGLVEPVDDMEQPAWHADLLDWLAEDLVTHGYDLRHMLRVILTSQAYQRRAVDVPERPDDYVFRGPAVRRLTAEQFVDAISAVTGVWQPKTDGTFDFSLVPSHAAPRPSRRRAAFIAATPLMTALGRPNREQVVTDRAYAATTLQALELANGESLAATLRTGAQHLVKMRPRDPGALVTLLFRRAFSRLPTDAERQIGLEALGATISVEGVEDLLWMIVMQPEFQLVY